MIKLLIQSTEEDDKGVSTADASFASFMLRNGERVPHPKVDNLEDPKGLQAVFYPSLLGYWKRQFRRKVSFKLLSCPQ